MKIIYLTKNQVTFVDDEDYDQLNQHKWFADKGLKDVSYYAKRNGPRINGKRKKILMHRVILRLTDPKILGDHIDHNTLNNQRYNLREATSIENQRNGSSRKGSISNYKGVCWHKASKKWITKISINKKEKHIGLFLTEKEAAIAYDNAARIYHKEFANLNFK